MKINLAILKSFLIFCVGFFLPWGANLPEVGGYPPLLFIIATIALSIFLFSTGINVSPAFRLFILFLLLHIAVTTIIFGKDYLFFERIQPRNLWPGATYLTSENNMTLIRKLLFLISFFVILSSIIKKNKEWFILAVSFIVGLGVVCLLKLKFAISLFPDNRFAGAYDDPNAFGIAACIAFFLAILLFNNVRILFLKVCFIAASIFFFVMILLSQSRGAFVALLCASFMMLKGKKLPVYKLLLIIGVILFIVFYFLMPLFPTRFLMPESWVANRGSKRLDIWAIYLSQLWKFFLTGVGFLRSKDVISTGILGREFIAHNVFLEILVEFGIVGLSLFCFVLRKLRVSLKSLPDNPPYKPELKAIFVVWIIGASFISSLILRETWLVFALITTAPIIYRDRVMTV